MSRLMLTTVAALTLALTGCGVAAAPGGAVSSATTTIGPPAQRSLQAPSPTVTPVTPAGPVLTAADTGTTITAVTGERITVDLAPGPGAYSWHRPRLTGSALRLLSVAGGYPVRGPLVAVFLATGPGTVVLSASTDVPCLHRHPACAIAVRLWTIRVVVR